jgi:hypothetical protein
MNRLQREYAEAKATLDAIQARMGQDEAEYCRMHECTDEDGNPVNRIYQIDDNAAFEAANNGFWALHEHDAKEEHAASKALRQAEDALIQWGISVMPSSPQLSSWRADCNMHRHPAICRPGKARITPVWHRER